MNFATQLRMAAENQRAMNEAALAGMSPQQREAFARRQRIRSALSSKPTTAYDIAKTLNESLNYVQKTLTDFEDEWGLSKRRTGNNVPYKWWLA